MILSILDSMRVKLTAIVAIPSIRAAVAILNADPINTVIRILLGVSTKSVAPRHIALLRGTYSNARAWSTEEVKELSSLM